ncbi:hypothetical protein [Blautia sp. An46]|uniref:hypothetical protein n=1 Tax=Blautia sp. An46 TaxID=1965636 RepID=UPI000B3A41EB|nr:hypothetical protein [Blautia sp. An46]OUN94021.1 hypothetical protein B5G00_03940 [Blautia sp. An46]
MFDMMKRKNAEDILEILYLLAFAVYIGFFFLGTTMFQIEWPNFFYTDLRTVIAALILVRAAYSKQYKIWEVAVILGLYILFSMASSRNGYEEYMYLLILIIGARGISFKKLIKVYAAVTAVLLIITIAAALSGYIENLTYYQEGRRTRYAFGINYPTDFSAILFYLILAWFYIRGKKLKYIELGIAGLLGIFVYWFCDARMNTICIIGASLVFAVHKFFSKKAEKKQKEYRICKPISMLLILSGILCSLVMTGLTMLYSPNNPIIAFIDNALSSRLRLGHKGIDIYCFTLWGQNIPMIGLGSTTKDVDFYFFLDSSYIYNLLQFGLLIAVLLLAAWTMISGKAYIKKEWELLLILAIIAVQCMVEHHMVSVAFNPFWMALLGELSVETTKGKKVKRGSI